MPGNQKPIPERVAILEEGLRLHNESIAESLRKIEEAITGVKQDIVQHLDRLPCKEHRGDLGKLFDHVDQLRRIHVATKFLALTTTVMAFIIAIIEIVSRLGPHAIAASTAAKP